MSQQQGPPMLAATFVPGGFDDYYMPAPAPEVVSPLPQRVMPEVPEQMQDNIAHLELEADVPRSVPLAGQWAGQSTNPQQAHPPNAGPAGAMAEPQRHQSYSSLVPREEGLPNFSPFPKLVDPSPNVPPTDEEKEAILENARVPVLNSNDPEMQLAWAQDALAYAATSQAYEERAATLDNKPPRPGTPAVEHQIKIDSMNIVEFLAQQRHPKAEFMKGMWLEFGNFGVRQDKREAFRSYMRSAEKGFSRAEYRMGMQFEQNNDPVKALIHYQRGAEAGDSASNYRLGMMTLIGQMGQPQDHAKGIQMLQIAAGDADENAPQGAYVLGMLQARELPQVTVPETLLPYDEHVARENIEKAAYLGFAKAQVKMGAAYELCSMGCEFDPALSLHYNALAARQGESEAEMAISKWFLCGHEGVFKKSEELAYIYANRAAQSGLATAEFAMGYFHEIGLYVPANLDEATAWYQKAANNGNEDAKARIEGLKHSQTLSKKDHENVAINRIKSQYGSKRGGRPARFQKQAPGLSTVSDDPEEYGQSGRSTVPPRASSTAPYPTGDGPPSMGGPPRPSTVAPYPVDDRPPQIGGGQSFAGGFAPELRSASTAPPQHQRASSGSAFGINPEIYGQRKPPGSSQTLPMRPSTTVNDMRAGARAQNTQRIPSDPAQMLRGRGQGGDPRQQGPRLDIGYQAPMQGGLPNSVSPRLQQQQSANDIGYVAPLQPRRSPMQSPVTDNGSFARPPRGDSRPTDVRQSPRPGQQQNAQRPPPQNRPNNQPPPMSGGLPPGPRPGATAAARKASQPPPTRPGHSQPIPPGQGPKTFDAMGIPQAPKESDCSIM